MNEAERNACRQRLATQSKSCEDVAAYDALLEYLAAIRDALRGASYLPVIYNNPDYWPSDCREFDSNEPRAFFDTFNVRSRQESAQRLAAAGSEPERRRRHLESELCAAAVEAMDRVLTRHKRRIHGDLDAIFTSLFGNQRATPVPRQRQRRRIEIRNENSNASATEQSADGDPNAS